MKKILLFLFILLPGMCGAQEYRAGELSENRIDESAHDTIRRSNWQVLERGGITKKLNTFYRISRINGKFFLDLKIIEGGDIFVVARNAELKLMLENGNILILYNSAYQVSCIGCGDVGFAGGGAQGATLLFPLADADIHTVLQYYVAKIGINTGGNYMQKTVNEKHSELFVDELKLVMKAR